MEQIDEVTKYQMDTSNQDTQVEINENTAEASNVETKQSDNTRTRRRIKNAGEGVERLEMKFGGEKYGTQLINTEEKEIIRA